eukprot:9270620-Pyramimonas_sp.AAC.1
MDGLVTDQTKYPILLFAHACFADCVNSSRSTTGPRHLLPAQRCVQEANCRIALVRGVRDRGSRRGFARRNSTIVLLLGRC